MDILTTGIAVIALALACYNTRQLLEQRNPAAATIAPTEPDPWDAQLATWLASIPASLHIAPATILAGALPGTAANRANGVRLTAAMKRLGYRATYIRPSEGAATVRVFVPAANKEAKA